MSGNESMKNKLVNSMKMTKQGTAKTTTATEIKEEPVVTKAPVAKKPAIKSAIISNSTSGCRVWPD